MNKTKEGKLFTRGKEEGQFRRLTPGGKKFSERARKHGPRDLRNTMKKNHFRRTVDSNFRGALSTYDRIINFLPSYEQSGAIGGKSGQ